IPMRVVAEALQETRFALGDTVEIHHAFAEASGGLSDNLPIGELVREDASQLASDLVPPASEGCGHRHDTHGTPRDPSRARRQGFLTAPPKIRLDLNASER